MNTFVGEERDFVIAVIADTHLPDRCHQLPAVFLPELKALRPDLILHAGDIITPEIIRIIETVAPVVMVRGNRDIFFFPYVPRKKEFSINGVMISLVHGHARLFRYLINKVRYLLFNYRFEWFLPLLLEEGEGADVIVYGHTHRPMNKVLNHQLLFNPGSLTISPEKGVPLSYGVLRISANGDVTSEIVEIN